MCLPREHQAHDLQLLLGGHKRVLKIVHFPNFSTALVSVLIFLISYYIQKVAAIWLSLSVVSDKHHGFNCDAQNVNYSASDIHVYLYLQSKPNQMMYT